MPTRFIVPMFIVTPGLRLEEAEEVTAKLQKLAQQHGIMLIQDEALPTIEIPDAHPDREYHSALDDLSEQQRIAVRDLVQPDLAQPGSSLYFIKAKNLDDYNLDLIVRATSPEHAAQLWRTHFAGWDIPAMPDAIGQLPAIGTEGVILWEDIIPRAETITSRIVPYGCTLTSTGGGCEAWQLTVGDHYIYLTDADGSTARDLTDDENLILCFYEKDADHSDFVQTVVGKWSEIEPALAEFASGQWQPPAPKALSMAEAFKAINSFDARFALPTWTSPVEQDHPAIAIIRDVCKDFDGSGIYSVGCNGALAAMARHWEEHLNEGNSHKIISDDLDEMMKRLEVMRAEIMRRCSGKP